MKERAAQERGGRKPTYLTSATSVLTSIKAVSVVPSGGDKTGVHREITDVRWVGFHPLSGKKKLLSQKRNTTIHLHAFREKKHNHSPSCILGKETTIHLHTFRGDRVRLGQGEEVAGRETVGDELDGSLRPFDEFRLLGPML